VEQDLDKMERVVALEDIYDCLLKIHVEIGHGGRDRIINRLNDMKIVNIGRQIIEQFVKLCMECSGKKVKPSTGIVVKPIISAKFGSRFQADLVDMQATPDGDYK
jgi:hypothetical protein